MVVGKVQGVMSVSCFPGSAGSVGVEGGSSFRMWRGSSGDIGGWWASIISFRSNGVMAAVDGIFGFDPIYFPCLI